MNLENYQSYIFPIIIFLFFGYRFYRFRVIKRKIPQMLTEGALIVDVRTKGEYTQGHNPLSINIPLDDLNSESSKLEKSKTIIVCCASGTRSAIALGILKKNGFKNVMNAGSWGNTLS